MNSLPVTYRFDEETMNITFNGSYALLKYIIEKYGIYNSQITKFITENCYGISASSSWRKIEVPSRVWNIIHKDLIILMLSGKIAEDKVMTLEELNEEFQVTIKVK